MNDKIKCPNCSHLFDVEEAISGQLQAHFKAEFEIKVAEQAKIFNKKQIELEKEKEDFQKKKDKENELFAEKLEEKLKKEKEIIQTKTKEDFELQLKSLKEENELKKIENRELKTKEIDLLKRENELKEKAEELDLSIQKKILEKQTEIEDKVRVKEREKTSLVEKEYQKKLADQKVLIEEMKRKAEQGSMQLQGEVQELAIEDLLKTNYPFDIIEEVPKGINGADVIQTVINSSQNECGKIVYESKRTKNFDNKWIEKLKQDQIRVKGEISVLVTQTMPKGMLRFDFKDGVWICNFNELSSLSKVLREMLLKTQSIKLVQENKGDKMELLYNYLTSNDFTQKVKRIIENYDSMINQLNSEKKATFRNWAEREKHIWIVQENINALFGDIKGIGGSALPSSDILELPKPEIE